MLYFELYNKHTTIFLKFYYTTPHTVNLVIVTAHPDKRYYPKKCVKFKVLYFCKVNIKNKKQ
mgnify:CR=1 FL=1